MLLNRVNRASTDKSLSGSGVFSVLPPDIQQKIMHLLQTDNFKAAKVLYDVWKKYKCSDYATSK